MKKIKRVLSVMLCAMLIAAMLPTGIIAQADTVYTVRLEPGDGSGTPVEYRSDEGEIAADWHSAQYGQFYYEDGGVDVGFYFNYDSCPSGWTAPDDDHVFDCFDTHGVFYNTLTSETTVFTAQWKEKTNWNTVPDASFTVSSPNANLSGFDADGYMPFTYVTDTLTPGKVKDFNGEYVYTDGVYITLFKGTLDNGNGGSLAFGMYNDDHRGDGEWVKKYSAHPAKATTSRCASTRRRLPPRLPAFTRESFDTKACGTALKIKRPAPSR
ncbi:MAG: hypothetical protein IKX98_06935 [Clostridia bacterium]|nr:hypothetical protein [Clostridia bacterium]